MGFLSNLFGSKAKLRSPEEAHPELGPLVSAFAGMDGRIAQSMFPYSRGRWDLRACLVELTAERYYMKFQKEMRASMIDGLVAQGEIGWQLAGAAWHVLEGWEARGSGGADTVSKAGWAELERRCLAAQQQYEAIGARDAEDPTPFTMMMQVAKGLSLRALGEAAYHGAVQRDPGGYEHHARYLGLVSKRWFGSHDEVLAVARQVAARAADGSDAAALPINAHYDIYSHTCVFDKDVPAARARLADPTVRAELAATCARSLDAPGYALTTATYKLRHRAAVLFWEAGDKDHARAQLAAAGDVFFKDAWWQASNEPEKTYESVRSELGLGPKR